MSYLDHILGASPHLNRIILPYMKLPNALIGHFILIYKYITHEFRYQLHDLIDSLTWLPWSPRDISCQIPPIVQSDALEVSLAEDLRRREWEFAIQ